MYLRDNITGLTAQAGVFDPDIPGTENRMRPCTDGFEGTGIAAVNGCIASPSEWATVDEIGYLDSASEAYCAALRRLMSLKHVAAVVRRQHTPFIDELLSRDDAFIVDMDSPYGNAGCVIMASGMGVRFGGNKLVAPLGGKKLIEWTFEATEGIFAQRVVVTRSRGVEKLCCDIGIDAIYHELPHRSDTVRLGVEALTGCEGCMFCQADQPLISRDTILTIALAARNDRSAIWRAAYGETPGAPVMFPRSLFGELMDLPEGKGGGAVIKKHPEKVRIIEAASEMELMDVDTPEDLARLAAHISAAAPM